MDQFGLENRLSVRRPELVPEWSEKNLPLTPDDVTYGSRKKVWWKCPKGHEYAGRGVAPVSEAEV